MTGALAAALLAGCAFAAPARKAAATVAPAAISDAAVDWLRVYPLAEYREFWTTTTEVKSLQKDLPRVMAAVEKHGGALVTPLANSAASPTAGTQQLTYRLTVKDAPSALKALKKIGLTTPPQVRPSGEKLPASEIKSKLEALAKDKREHAAELARMPAVSGLVDAAMGHLAAADAVAERAGGEVVLDLTVQERAPQEKKQR